MRSRSLSLCAAVLLAACSPSPPDPSTPARAWRTKLVDQAQASWSTSRKDPRPVDLEIGNFEDGLRQGVWRLASDSKNPLRTEDGVLAAEAEGDALTLAGTRGLAYRIVEVEPATCYRFEATAEARALELSGDFAGATVWIAELSRSGSPEELFQNGPEEFAVARHLFDPAWDADVAGGGRSGTKDYERLVFTSPETRALLIACVLSWEAPAKGGDVRFEEVSLEKLPLAAQWRADLDLAKADYARGLEPLSGWRATRLVRGQLGAEVRPSILLLPGERLRFEATLSSARPLFESGFGLWSPALLPGTGRGLACTITIDGEEVFSLTNEAQDDPAEARWNQFEIDLSAWSERTVQLELAVDGDLPGLFGAPVLRDGAATDERKNVLLISIDTLRADYVGCYGAPGNPTPHLDRLAEEGILCARVDGQAPYTLPGHATLLSGQFPSVHGVQRTTHALSTKRSPLLARILSAEGYRTQAFTGGGFLNADFGFDRGFDGFANIDPLRQRDALFFRQIVNNEQGALRRLRRNSRLPDRITEELIDEFGPERVHGWLEEHADEPFFLFVHTYAVHDYDPPAEYLRCHEELGCTSNRVDYEEHRLTRQKGWNPSPISAADAAHLTHLYEATLRFVDDLIGELLAELDRLGLRESTIVAVATDHGEEMFERGFMQHGKTLYEELTSLPMIFRIPGEAPRVIQEPAMQVDLVPTLLDALGLESDGRMQGASLLAPLPERATWSEIHDDFVEKYALRTRDGWKLLHAPSNDEVDFPADYEWKLFDLNQDPRELEDLSASDREQLERLREELLRRRELLGTFGASLGEVGEGNVDPSVQRQLKGLGYTGD